MAGDRSCWAAKKQSSSPSNAVGSPSPLVPWVPSRSPSLRLGGLDGVGGRLLYRAGAFLAPSTTVG